MEKTVGLMKGIRNCSVDMLESNGFARGVRERKREPPEPGPEPVPVPGKERDEEGVLNMFVRRRRSSF